MHACNLEPGSMGWRSHTTAFSNSTYICSITLVDVTGLSVQCFVLFFLVQSMWHKEAASITKHLIIPGKTLLVMFNTNSI